MLRVGDADDDDGDGSGDADSDDDDGDDGCNQRRKTSEEGITEREA